MRRHAPPPSQTWRTFLANHASHIVPTDLDDDARAALHQALLDSEEDVRKGRLVDADVVLRELRSR